MLDLNKL